MVDCDTRTLLLYTVLSHYDYGDVVILKSDIYMHSILGVTQFSSGQTKVINGKFSYLLWETTAKNLPPGFIDQNHIKFGILGNSLNSLTLNKQHE